MIKCSQCGMGFDRQQGEGPVASISGGIMGDEYIELVGMKLAKGALD